MKIKKNNFLFLTFFLIFFLIISPLPINKIEQIQIKNSHGLSTEPLEKITKKYINKNIFLSLIDLNLQDLTKKIPSIDAYKLHLVYPHKIIIKVIEKKPWISIYSEGENISVSTDGYFLNKNNDHPIQNPQNLIIIKNLPKEIFKNDYLSNDYLNTFHSITDAINDSFPTQSFQMEPYKWGQWVLWLGDQIPMYLNNDTNSFKKQLKRAAKILQNNSKSIRYIDLRIPKKVIIRYE